VQVRDLAAGGNGGFPVKVSAHSEPGRFRRPTAQNRVIASVTAGRCTQEAKRVSASSPTDGLAGPSLIYPLSRRLRDSLLADRPRSTDNGNLRRTATEDNCRHFAQARTGPDGWARYLRKRAGLGRVEAFALLH